MKYALNDKNYHDFDVYEVNKLPGRSYFIPYPDRASADAAAPKEKRYSSSKVRCLNGEWDFKFYPVPSELPDTLDTDTVAFGRIDVPSCWQFRGYDKPFYSQYPLPVSLQTAGHPHHGKGGHGLQLVRRRSKGDAALEKAG